MRTYSSAWAAVRDRLEMIYIEYAAPERVKTFRHEVGDRIDIKSSSAGRAYLAALPEDTLVGEYDQDTVYAYDVRARR